VRGEKPRKLIVTDKRARVIKGACDTCRKQLVSRLPEAETGEWEIKVEFERHLCRMPLAMLPRNTKEIRNF
jgi:hypothetical protein